MSDCNDAGAKLVCVFDSGVGGLNVMHACAILCPEVDFVYFADNYNVPYGSLDSQKVKSLVFEAFGQMSRLNPAAAIVACNTATALCIADLRSTFTFPILGIQPAIKQAAALPGTCLVLATPATASSSSFANLCSLYGDGRVQVVACPTLATYIEANIALYPGLDVSAYLPQCVPSSVVLGCTHYVFAKQSISRYYGAPIFDGILGTADHLRTLLHLRGKTRKNRQIIGFKNGDISKNYQVFQLLMKNSNIYF